MLVESYGVVESDGVEKSDGIVESDGVEESDEVVESVGTVATEGVVSERVVDRAVVNTVESVVSVGILVGCMVVAVGLLVVN